MTDGTTDEDDERTASEQRTAAVGRSGGTPDRSGDAVDRSSGAPDRWAIRDDASTDAPDASLGALDRRDYLKAVGAAGAASALVGSGATAGAQEDWEAAADERIEEHRTSAVEVVVEDGNGEPVQDAEVDVEMQRHDFTFGTAIHAEFLTRGTEWGDDFHTEEDRQNYAEAVEEYFNAVVLENLHKWLFWEENQEIADEAVDWALERDMDVRGHVCLWGNVDAYAVPPDVCEAIGVEFDHDDFDEVDPDPDHARQRSMEHIQEIIEYYGDDVLEWEIVNEAIHETALIEGIEGDVDEPHTAEILGDWYEHAEEIAGQYDVPIAVNDYNTMVGPIGETRGYYEDQIDYLVNERGIDVDGIGFQCHFGYRHDHDQRLSPDEILENLDRFAEYGAGLRVTEFDMFEGYEWTEELQAEYMHQFLKTFFSHPEAEHFLMWGIWDPIHWGDELGEQEKDAPLFREDWTPKPAFDSYYDLVFDEWWTEASGTTDADGTVAVDAFLGKHEVTVSTGGEPVTETVEITDPEGTSEVVVTVGDPVGPCEDAGGESMEVDGQRVCNLDGDEYYRDVNGDGTVGNRDVGAFFENFHFDAFDREEFDYSGNGRVSHGDVVALFDYVV